MLNDEVFGTHARYLLARVHHLDARQNEREEARTQYQAVLKGHEEAKKRAEDRLRQPDQLRNDPEKRARLEQLARGPVPDHVARAAFFLGVLQYEDGRHAEALEHFKTFVTRYPSASLSAEAKLRQGFCQVQLKQYDDALRTLTPLADKEAALADQALLWMAKAQAGKADPAKPDSYKPALETFRKAATKASDKVRRGEILVELAEAQLLAKQPKDAAGTLNEVLTNKLLPGREDEVLLSLATAQQLAGDYPASDKVCERFLAAHKESPLLPAVLFRRAENAAFQALAARKLPNPADRTRETAKHNDEAIKRYAALIEDYPEHPHVYLARQGLGMAYYRKGDLEKAQKALEAIPAAERSGELAVVSYQLADLYLRLAPPRADDAVTAGKLEEKLKGASDLLENYLGAAGDSPPAPDALLKLGYCQHALARLLNQPAEQAKALAAARTAYERLLQKFGKHASAPQAAFERAKVLGLQKDLGGAINELKRFAADPLKKAGIAPLALLHLATLQRSQNRPAEAAATLADCRKEHEDALTRDPARSGWVLLLRYHHGVALREAGKLEEARGLFDLAARGAPDRPEAWDAALRAGQCQKEAGEKRIAEAQKQLATSLKPEQRSAAEKRLADAMQEVRTAATYLASQETSLRGRKVPDEQLRTLQRVRARMLYEAAWGWRELARLEQDAARKKVQLERWQRRRDELARQTPPGQSTPAVALPEVDVRDVPVQPAETQARLVYRNLIAVFPDSSINADARFELAEVLAQRNEHDEAVKLLQGALEGEKEPSAELTDRIKVRLASCLLDRGVRKRLEARRLQKPADKAAAQKLAEAGTKDVEQALEQVQAVTANDKSAMLAHATYREAECLLHLGKPDEAIKLLAKFRDHGPFQNLPGLTDRALLRLGFALGEKKQWDASRQAYERLAGAFGSSPWRHEARYGIGWAYQNQAQYDNAVNAYHQVTAAVTTELAARAQLNVGVCRLLQKRYSEASTALLVVPFTYDYPALSALALMEAARAFHENKQTGQAVRLLRRVVKDHAGTALAEAAQKRLKEMGEES